MRQSTDSIHCLANVAIFLTVQILIISPSYLMQGQLINIAEGGFQLSLNTSGKSKAKLSLALWQTVKPLKTTMTCVRKND